MPLKDAPLYAIKRCPVLVFDFLSGYPRIIIVFVVASYTFKVPIKIEFHLGNRQELISFDFVQNCIVIFKVKMCSEGDVSIYTIV